MSVRKSNTLRFSKRVYATVLPLTHGAGKPSVTHCTLAAACAVSYRAEFWARCVSYCMSIVWQTYMNMHMT